VILQVWEATTAEQMKHFIVINH